MDIKKIPKVLALTSLKPLKKTEILVYFVTVKKPNDTKIDIDILVQYFGSNIPKYIKLETMDKSGEYYICCMKPEVDVREICHYMGYIFYNKHESVVDSKTFNRLHKVVIAEEDSDDEFYRLVEQ